jgi:hypothetical protein
MAEYITKKVPTYQSVVIKDEATGEETKKKEKTGEKEVTYRIDADFTPSKLDEISIEFVINYCEANNQAEWLYEKLTTKVPCKIKKTGETKLREIPFVKLREEFVSKFFPALKKGKKLSPTETFLQKYGKKK